MNWRTGVGGLKSVGWKEFFDAVLEKFIQAESVMKQVISWKNKTMLVLSMQGEGAVHGNWSSNCKLN